MVFNDNIITIIVAADICPSTRDRQHYGDSGHKYSSWKSCKLLKNSVISHPDGERAGGYGENKTRPNRRGKKSNESGAWTRGKKDTESRWKDASRRDKIANVFRLR